jgi:hypothetical protein
MKVSIPNSEEWKSKRLKQWETLEYAKRSNESKEMLETLAASKIWFVNGDLTALIDCDDSLNRDGALSLNNVMWLCPAFDKTEYIAFMKNYSNWLSLERRDYWKCDSEGRDQRAIERMVTLYSNRNDYSTEEIFAYFLKKLMPDAEGNIEFPFELGQDAWRPKGQVIVSGVVFNNLQILTQYVYGNDNDFKGCAHLKLSLPFISENITKLDNKYYDTKLLDGSYITHDGKKLKSAGQKLMRAVLGKICGYKTEVEEYDGPLRHNDPYVEGKLINIFNESDMPEAYNKLIKFIHEHKEDCVNP